MKDLTQGSVIKTILAMAIPVAASMLFQTLYVLIDLYFVAAISEDAVAGVGTAGTLMFMIMAITQVLGVSAVALISQAVGRKDQVQANIVFNQSLVLSLLCAFITITLGYVLGRSYLAGISADQGALEEGVTFLYWFLPAMAVQFPIIAMASSLRATGIVQPTMIIQIVTVLLNIVLAPILIAGWGPGPALGVMGAALATTIASFVGLLLITVYFIKLEKYVAIKPATWMPNFKLWWRMFDIGLPAGGEMVLLFVYFAAVYWLIQDFGATAQAGFSIGGRVMQSIFLPTMAIAFAVGPIVGQNFGAGFPDRVRETFYKGMLLSTVVMLTVTIILQWRPEIVVRVFTDEPEVVRVASVFLQIVSWNFITQGIVFTASGVFQGLGNTRPSLFSSMLRIVVFVPLALFVSNREGFVIEHVWYVSVVSVVIQACFSVWLVTREFRKRFGDGEPEPQAAAAGAETGQG
ncbi:MAG: MATE family efflux transporter [Gammaproteobacteria bacterium]